LPDYFNLDGAREFFQMHSDFHLFSTRDEIANYSGDLFNVDGSSCDPKLDKSWKKLLKSRGINSPCYVTNIEPAGKSHPKGWLGGHMTDDKNGQVANGGECYLMPLCSWHNSTARNKVAFKHTKTKMLKLSGYMNCDTPLTFALRKEGKNTSYRVAQLRGDELDIKDLNQNDMEIFSTKLFREVEAGNECPNIILRRVKNGFRLISAVGFRANF